MLKLIAVSLALTAGQADCWQYRGPDGDILGLEPGWKPELNGETANENDIVSEPCILDGRKVRSCYYVIEGDERRPILYVGYTSPEHAMIFIPDIMDKWQIWKAACRL